MRHVLHVPTNLQLSETYSGHNVNGDSAEHR